MNNKNNEQILKLHSDLLNKDEQIETSEMITNSQELKEFDNLLIYKLSELKDIGTTFPNEHYSSMLVNKVLERAEERRTTGMKPTFAYAMIVSFIIVLTSQFVSFNSSGNYFESDYFLESMDLGEYVSTNDLINLNNISLSEIEYFSYLEDNSANDYYFASTGYELIDMIDQTTQDEIFNEIINKNILGN